MDKHLFNLKFAAKQLDRNAKKCDKEEKAEKVKLKRAIGKGNMDGARIHAENSIRQKNQVDDDEIAWEWRVYMRVFRH
eukprot:m.93850 g.93850  ORF g.93850 m.93850 type:complete len:78 (+) comp36803_c0_seq15:807-1040(+)